jgi:NadR type nicotinamide-nucleotide adenylyltransferase
MTVHRSGEPGPGRPRRGLTLGKYAPLHRGHQLVIETALREMDEVVVIVYHSPRVTRVPLGVRSGWLRSLYPSVRVVEAWDGPACTGYTEAVMRAHERYVIDTLGIDGISHFYSSEPYGEHMSCALGAVNRSVDPARSWVPVSATQVRSDPFAHRHHLHPLVYRDLVVKVALLGAPCTGKTTLARRLAESFETVWAPEFGREYWEAHQIERRLTPEQLVEIARGQLEREEALLARANRFLFSDTSALSTHTFARYYHGTVHPGLRELARDAARRYDAVFVCDTDIPYDATWDRSGAANRGAFQEQVLGDLHAHRVPYHVLRGDLPTRMATVAGVLARLRGFDNPGALYHVLGAAGAPSAAD